MRITKQARRDGKALFRGCFDPSGRLNEARASETVRQVIAAKPRGYLAALAHFQRLLRLHVQSRRARIENAVESSPELMKKLQAALEARYGAGLDISYGVNPSLLGGLKIRIGSDVYDGSVRARLDALKAQF